MSNSTSKRRSSNFIDIFAIERKPQTIELAVKLYTNALEHDPTEVTFYCLRSYCYSEAGDFEAALKDAVEVTREWKHRPHGWFVMEKALAGQRIYKEADEARKKVLETKKHPDEDVEKLIKDDIRRDFIIWSASKELLASTNATSKGHGGGDSKDVKNANNTSHKTSSSEKKPSSASKSKDSKTEKDKDSDRKRRRSRTPEPSSKVESKVISSSSNHKDERPRSPKRSRDNHEEHKRSEKHEHDDDADHFRVVDSIGDDDTIRREEVKRGRSHSPSCRDVRGSSHSRRRSPRRSPSSERRDRDRPHRSKSRSIERPKEPPINIYRFTGIRIRNIYPQVQTKLIHDMCSRIGRVIHIEMKDRECIVTFSDAETPRRAIAELHQTFVHRVSNFQDKLIVRFALGSNQDKFHMRNVRRVDCDECHFYRTTGCEDKTCPETHIPFNAGIDLQPWMKRTT